MFAELRKLGLHFLIYLAVRSDGLGAFRFLSVFSLVEVPVKSLKPKYITDPLVWGPAQTNRPSQ